MKKLILLLVVVLASCSSAPPAPQIVYVAVPTPCVKDILLIPDYEFGKLSLDAADGEKVLALARDWPRARKYEDQLEAVIAGCR